MKKLVLLILAFASAGAFGQGLSDLSMREIYFDYAKLNHSYIENYDVKNFKRTEMILKEMISFVEGIRLPEADIAQYQPAVNNLKANTYYNLACTQSLLNKRREAVGAFGKAVEFGYANYQHARRDADLDNIRKDKRFIALMEKLKLLDKLVILQSSGAYLHETADSLPRFIYQPSDNINLKLVRDYFKLDTLGGDDEIEKIKNLLFFATRIVKYDGTNWGVSEFDAIDFYNYHKTTGRGINCRHKAMMLNEMYLAMGYKSRYVTCMPKDQDDPDCHVINCVWSETLGKWLWMDPSHGIYVTDENGNMLGIGEVRARLKGEEPLELNTEAMEYKKWYLDYYMAKNLYWLTCYNISRFNTESRYRNQAADLESIALLPIGYGEGNPYLKGDDIIIHDPDYFWQKPE